MIELICALIFGLFFGYSLRPHKVPINLELYTKVNKLEEEVSYYKNLCKWHAERKDVFFEEGRQQGMKQERALWKLAESSQEIGDE